ncbi:hypothetical protein HG530_008943 [Fusarium avenaceum]|nr:hypothetical protein HG530_008943 [Fusarium avenaceum]
MADHTRGPEANKTPPIDLPTSPESLAALALVHRGGNTLSLSLGLLNCSWFCARDLVSSLLVHDMEHGADGAFVTSWRDDGVELLARAAESLYVFTAGQERNLSTSKNSLNGQLEKDRR